MRDYADVKGDGRITQALAQLALAMLDVDPLGLDVMDRKLLDAVIHRFDGGPVGLDNVAAAIGEESGTIEDVIEPYLIQQGYLQRTPRGRIATLAAYRHLGVAPPTTGVGRSVRGLSARARARARRAVNPRTRGLDGKATACNRRDLVHVRASRLVSAAARPPRMRGFRTALKLRRAWPINTINTSGTRRFVSMRRCNRRRRCGALKSSLWRNERIPCSGIAPHGFTLIEVMITVAIVAILAAVAVPSYSAYVTRGHLADAASGLAATRAQMERHYQDNRSYATVGAFTTPCAAADRLAHLRPLRHQLLRHARRHHLHAAGHGQRPGVAASPTPSTRPTCAPPPRPPPAGTPAPASG